MNRPLRCVALTATGSSTVTANGCTGFPGPIPGGMGALDMATAMATATATALSSCAEPRWRLPRFSPPMRGLVWSGWAPMPLDGKELLVQSPQPLKGTVTKEWSTVAATRGNRHDDGVLRQSLILHLHLLPRYGSWSWRLERGATSNLPPTCFSFSTLLPSTLLPFPCRLLLVHGQYPFVALSPLTLPARRGRLAHPTHTCAH